MSKEKESFWKAWDERLSALRQIPPVLKIVWESGPGVVTWGIVVRVITALLPIALLAVSKRIIDNIVRVVERHEPIPHTFWWLVAAEFALAVASSVLTRLLDYLDSVLADKYTRHVSIEVMRHAAQLDLIAYEDPVFYDRLERARVQATDRLGMIQSIGRLLQQVVTALSLSISIVYFSPWLLLLLVAGVIPAFLGESHFAFLGYAKNFMQTPIRRKLDYLRILGGSKEAAKELKLFGLSGYLTEKFTKLSDAIYDQNVNL
jgi:ATP-binding cassette subfamily B protein